MSEKESIRAYFRGKNIFMTGGSGFIGKALIEKLLRTCSDLRTVYILLRPKKGKSITERLNEILSSPLFGRLKKENPGVLKKVIPIKGDTLELGLGISDSDRQLLIDEVNIVFNVAASVKFDEFVKDAILSNLRSTRESALLALEMKKIEVFLHVSTAYSNIDQGKVVMEKLYPSPGNWRDAILAAENSDPLTMDVFSEKYIGDFPNSYTYTKRLAEHCVNDLLIGKMHVVISRPTVVVGSMTEPFEGWIDNFNGPVGLLMAGGSGLLRAVYGNPENDTDYNAVDNTVKCMIVSAWYQVLFGDVSKLSIYHMSKHTQVKVELKKFIEIGKSIYWEVPFERKIWIPWNKATDNWYEYFTIVLFLQMLPAVLIDILIRIAGHSPKIVKLQRKIYIANLALCYFTTHDWIFVNDNVMMLSKKLPVQEKKHFYFLTFPKDDISIYNFFVVCAQYCRIHLLKESEEITPQNRSRTLRMYYIDQFVKLLFLIIGLWIFFVKINFPSIIWSSIYNYVENLH